MSAESHEQTLIQIVDENDNPLRGGTMDEAQLTPGGLWHRVARVMVHNQTGLILLQKRSENSFTFPGCWDNSAAGHVDEGEEYEQSAARELEEETGIKNVTLEQIMIYKTDFIWKGRRFKRFNGLFKAIVDDNIHLEWPESEVSELRWFTIEGLHKLMAANDPDNPVTDGMLDVYKQMYI